MGVFDSLFNKGSKTNSKTPGMSKLYGSQAQYITQLIESMDLIDSTLNPGTFFSRYQFASNTACQLMEVKKVIYKGMTPEQIFKMLNDQNSKYMLQKQFIDRLFDAHRENSIVYQMNEVGHKLTREAKEYYLARLAGRTFHFCKVKFDVNSNKTYTYVTKDKNLAIGDSVTVFTGNGEYAKQKLVQVVDVFDDCIENLPFKLEELRCIDSKLKGIECPHCGASIFVDVSQRTGKCEYCGSEFYLL